MARPTKSVNALSDYSQTKAEIAARAEIEQKLKCEGLPEAPEWLTDRQREIFNEIIDCLKESDMLAVNDVWILTKTAIAIDRIESIEKAVNDNGIENIESSVLSALKQYTSDFYRGCNELCLSPQSRAKLANTAMTKDKKKPLEGIIEKAKGL